MRFATKLHENTHLTLHYCGKLKIQIFCKYSADTEENEENVNKLHF